MLATGSVAWLYYADRLVEFPLGVFSIALATVILPSLSAHHAEESPERFAATLDRALRLLLVIVVPASVALAVLAGPLTVVIFHYGRFTNTDVQMTQAALIAYAVALLGWSLVKVLAPGFFARQDTRTPMRSAVQSLGVTIALNLLFLGLAWHLGLLRQPGLHIVLAATNGVGAIFNAWTLYRGLRRQKVLVPSAGMVCDARPHPGGERRHGVGVVVGGGGYRILAFRRHARASVAMRGLHRCRYGRLLCPVVRFWACDRETSRRDPDAPAAAGPYTWVPIGRARMKLIRGLQALRQDTRGCAVTVGAYDGIHLGHQALLSRLGTRARAATARVRR